MLEGKGIILTFKVPQLADDDTCTFPLSNLGIGLAVQESLKITPITSGNYTVTKELNSAGDGYDIVVEGTGAVTANTLIHVFVIDIAKNDVISLSKDA